MFHRKAKSTTVGSQIRENRSNNQPEKATQYLLAAEHSQDEVNWLYHRIEQLHAYFSTSKDDIENSKTPKKEKKLAIADFNIALQSLENLLQKLKEVEVEVNDVYKQDAEWRDLHGVRLSPTQQEAYKKEAKRERKITALWDNLNVADIRSSLSESQKTRLDTLTKLRNEFVFERMVEVLLNEFSTIQNEGYKGSLRYVSLLKHTLYEIGKNKPLLGVSIPELIKMLAESDSDDASKSVFISKVDQNVKSISDDSDKIDGAIDKLDTFPKPRTLFKKALSSSGKTTPGGNASPAFFASQRALPVCPPASQAGVSLTQSVDAQATTWVRGRK